MCYGFLLQLKKVMGSTKPSLRYDGFGQTHQTHANATTDKYWGKLFDIIVFHCFLKRLINMIIIKIESLGFCSQE